jgi:iron complex transport system substrate-binding protein
MAMDQLALSASSVEGIFDSIVRVGERIGLAERGRAVVEREKQRLRALTEKTGGMQRPTLVMLEWTDPLFAMGNWGPDLVEMANGELLLSRKGEYSMAIAAEQLRAADPEYLIVAPCGFDLQRALLELPILERYAWWGGLRAVRNGNLIFGDGNLFFNRSGMTISQTAEMLAEILHGVPFGAPTEGIHWRRAHGVESRQPPKTSPGEWY